VCNHYGHVELDCYNRFNEAYACEQPPQAHAYLSAPSSSSDQNWYPNSGATHHLTSNLANLNIKAEDYIGSDKIRIGNGKGFSIDHIGTTCLFTPTSQFDLLDTLHVPLISKNLVFVHKFTKDSNTFFEFHPSYFLLKDRRTGKLLLHGVNKHGLYHFFPSANKHPHSAMVGERASFFQWHSQLGHPTLNIVRRVLSHLKLPVATPKESPVCTTCLGAKSKQLHFFVFFWNCLVSTCFNLY
jgi:hypothetical protein